LDLVIENRIILDKHGNSDVKQHLSHSRKSAWSKRSTPRFSLRIAQCHLVQLRSGSMRNANTSDEFSIMMEF
jgi:hypothetical protein